MKGMWVSILVDLGRPMPQNAPDFPAIIAREWGVASRIGARPRAAHRERTHTKPRPSASDHPSRFENGNLIQVAQDVWIQNEPAGRCAVVRTSRTLLPHSENRVVFSATSAVPSAPLR
jgi:hypothetical protein